MNGELETRTDDRSIGQRLREKREAAGLSIAAAAAKLHCDQTILTALEADRFDELGAPVFAQGHLRRYAELIGAPVAELLADWAKRGTLVATPDLTRIPRAPSRGLDREVWGRRLGALAGAVVIAVAAWWILRGGAVQTPPAVPVAAPSAAAIAPATPAITAAATLASPPAPATTLPDSAAAPLEVPAAAPMAPAAPVALAVPAAPAVAPAAPAVAARLAVAIEARENCWTEIYDAEGRKLYFDTLRSGNRAAVSGVAPLRVLLGRADRASLTIEGRQVAIPAALIRNTTAYFTVDAAAQLRDLPRPATTP